MYVLSYHILPYHIMACCIAVYDKIFCAVVSYISSCVVQSKAGLQGLPSLPQADSAVSLLLPYIPHTQPWV